MQASSEEVESVAHVHIRLALVLLCILRNLVCVHTDHRNLDRASEVVVVVAQMISGGLDLILSETGRVVKRLEEYWLGSGDCGLMGDQEEIKHRVSLGLNEGSINDCPVTGVYDFGLFFREETVLDVSVNQAVKNIGFVTRRCVLKVFRNCFYFFLLNHLSKTRTSHPISIDNDLFREHFSVIMPISYSLIEEESN